MYNHLTRQSMTKYFFSYSYVKNVIDYISLCEHLIPLLSLIIKTLVYAFQLTISYIFKLF